MYCSVRAISAPPSLPEHLTLIPLAPILIADAIGVSVWIFKGEIIGDVDLTPGAKTAKEAESSRGRRNEKKDRRPRRRNNRNRNRSNNQNK